MTFLISIGKIDKKYIIYPISTIIILIIGNSLAYETNIFKNLSKHLFVKLISKSFGKSLALILYLFSKNKNKNLMKKKNIIENKLVYKKEYIMDAKKKKLKKYSLIFLACLLNFSYKIFYHDFGGLDIGKYSLWILDIIYVCILSYFILHIKLYRHQYFSVIIIVLLGIALNAINLFGKNIFNVINFILVIIIETQYALNIVINKHLMDNLFCTAYEVCFFEGFFCLISSIICLYIFTNKEMKIGEINYKNKKYIDNFYHYFEYFNIKELCGFLFQAFIHLTSYLLCLLTIKYYTVFHIFIILIFDEFNFFEHDFKDWKIYIMIILYFIITFMILVFNEIIEINCCDLEKNTKRNIMKRASSDILDCGAIIDEESSEIKIENENEEDTVEIGQYKFDFPNNGNNLDNYFTE